MGRKKKTHAEYEQQLFEREIDCFPLEPYLGTMTPILHTCSKDHEWKASPDNILAGRRCPHCAGVAKKTTEQYKAELISKGIVFEVLEDYIGANIPIKHKCPKDHTWVTRPSHVLSGTGCPSCDNTWGFDPNKPAILYYVKLESPDKTYYKIGVTNSTIQDRFKNEKDKFLTIIKEEQFTLGSVAKEREQEILAHHIRTTDKDFLKSGYTELFEYDIGLR